MKNRDIDYILTEAIDQKEAGAHILNVNVGLPEIDEKEMMIEAVEEIQSIINLPLQIDSVRPDVIEAAVRIYNGKPIINSVDGKNSSMEKIINTIRGYGIDKEDIIIDCLTLTACAQQSEVMRQ